jgi:hypothetical protein
MVHGEWGMVYGEWGIFVTSVDFAFLISAECDDVNLSPATAPLSVQDFPALLLQPLGD